MIFIESSMAISSAVGFIDIIILSTIMRLFLYGWNKNMEPSKALGYNKSTFSALIIFVDKHPEKARSPIIFMPLASIVSSGCKQKVLSRRSSFANISIVPLL